MQKTYKILLPISIENHGFLEQNSIFDYLAPEGIKEIKIGQFVLVPFRNKQILGVVTATCQSDEKLPYVLRRIIKIFDDSFSQHDLEFLEWIAKYYLQSLGMVAKMALPDVSYLEKKTENIYQIIAPEFAKSAGQKKIIETLSENEMLPKEILLSESKVANSVLSNMVKRGILNEISVEQFSDEEPQKFNFKTSRLSEEQKKAANFLKEKCLQNKESTTLLNGVTGSGKTEVYFEVIKHILQNDPDAQILIMLPEIILTSQAEQRFTSYFGVPPIKWHSDLSKKEKRKNWQSISENLSKIVISTRSGLFLPFKNLKLIIVDEEHDFSYKQEDQVNYHGRDMAILKAHLLKIPVILASATPSLETIMNVKQKKYEEVILKSRYKEIQMPQIIMIDNRNLGKAKNSYSWLSPVFKKMMLEILSQDQQIMIFLNRRGYAPLTICNSCGFRYMCPNCSAWLVEHKNVGKMLCHHCDFSSIKEEKCSKCDAEDSFISCGPGVERINEEVVNFLKEQNLSAEIVLLTKDSTPNVQESAKLINKIIRNEVKIIIGTQIIAKGHDFPNLKLVGVVDADLGLNGGDLRASEKTYQLLSQVSGRPGRHGEQGRVVLQSFNPENPVMKALSSGQQNDFIEAEINARKSSKMPPFGSLASIVISSINEAELVDFAKYLVKKAPLVKDIEIFGPAPAIIFKLRNRLRYRILVKSHKKSNLQPYLKKWFAQIKLPKNIRMKLDIDPYSFM